jgi:hypothetical protein
MNRTRTRAARAVAGLLGVMAGGLAFAAEPVAAENVQQQVEFTCMATPQGFPPQMLAIPVTVSLVTPDSVNPGDAFDVTSALMATIPDNVRDLLANVLMWQNLSVDGGAWSLSATPDLQGGPVAVPWPNLVVPIDVNQPLVIDSGDQVSAGFQASDPAPNGGGDIHLDPSFTMQVSNADDPNDAPIDISCQTADDVSAFTATGEPCDFGVDADCPPPTVAVAPVCQAGQTAAQLTVTNAAPGPGGPVDVWVDGSAANNDLTPVDEDKVLPPGDTVYVVPIPWGQDVTAIVTAADAFVVAYDFTTATLPAGTCEQVQGGGGGGGGNNPANPVPGNPKFTG